MRAPSAIAADAFDEGVHAFDRGEHARALSAFETAYRIAPHPTVLFNIARAYEAMGHDTAAARRFLEFLDADTHRDEALRVAVVDALMRIRPRIAWLRVRALEGAVVSDAIVAPSEREQIVPVDPGLRTVRVSQRNAIVVRVSAGDELTVECARADDPIVVAARGVAPMFFMSSSNVSAQR